MKLYCVAIETKNIEDDNISDIRIDHFFANDKGQMEDRIYRIIKDIKNQGIETIKHAILQIDTVDGIDINKVFDIIYFNDSKEDSLVEATDED